MSNFIGDNINALRIHLGLNQQQFAQKIGTSQAAVSAWEVGDTSPRKSTAMKIAKVFHVSFDDIMSEDNGYARKLMDQNRTDGYIDIPVLSSIAAGQPIDLENVDDTFPIPERLHMRYPDAFLYRVEGDSMNRILPNGCYAVVEPCRDVKHDGKPYAVCVNGYAATIKRVKKLANGFQLVPDSTDPTYRPRTYDYNEPGTETITVIGEVVYYVLPYDWTF
jgi:repressor LexA